MPPPACPALFVRPQAQLALALAFAVRTCRSGWAPLRCVLFAEGLLQTHFCPTEPQDTIRTYQSWPAPLWSDLLHEGVLRITKGLAKRGWQGGEDGPFAQEEPGLGSLHQRCAMNAGRAALLGTPIDSANEPAKRACDRCSPASHAVAAHLPRFADDLVAARRLRSGTRTNFLAWGIVRAIRRHCSRLNRNRSSSLKRCRATAVSTGTVRCAANCLTTSSAHSATAGSSAWATTRSSA